MAECASAMQSHGVGPCGMTANRLIDDGAKLNGAFSEFAWANARQNSGCLPCPGKELPAWPPSVRDWGHTYPVQSKKGEEVQGSQMHGADGSSCGEKPFYTDSQPSMTSNPPEIFQRFAATDVPRGHSREAQEYDLALDVAEKILQGDSLSMHSVGGPSSNKPYSYVQSRIGSEYSSPVEHQSRHDVSPATYASANVRSNKRLANLLAPTEHPTEQTYAAGKEPDAEPLHGTTDDAHNWENVLPCAKNTMKGIAYDLQHWNQITPEQCDGNKLYYVFGRDDRWKYLTFVGMCFAIFILFILAIATSITNLNEPNNAKFATNSSPPNPPQRIELIIKPAQRQ